MDPAQFLQGRTRETEIRRDARGRWFNGEDRIDHTPKDERVRIRMGEAFDVVGDRRQMD